MGRCYYRDGLHGRSRKAAVDVATPSPAPKPYPLLAAAQPGSRNEPDSRPELQSLTGKGEESAGRKSAQAAPRPSRAPVQRDGSGRRRSALRRPTLPTASRRRRAAASKQIRGRGRHKPLLAARARPAQRGGSGVCRSPHTLFDLTHEHRTEHATLLSEK